MLFLVPAFCCSLGDVLAAQWRCTAPSRSMHLLQNISEWPQRGGANGSVRFYPEISHGANAGMPLVAVKCFYACLAWAFHV